MKETFATAISCVDGRVQLPVLEWIKENCKVTFVDMITSPGIDKVIAENTNKPLIESIKKAIGTSVCRHKSKHIFLIAHHDCLGNPVDEITHKEQIRKGIESIRSWDFDAEIGGLWINESWEVQEIPFD